MAASLTLAFRRGSSQLAVASRQLSVGAAHVKGQSSEDPVKMMFLDKLKEYRAQMKSGKVVVNEKTNKGLADDLNRLKRIYGDEDLSKFPEFQFKD